MSAAQKKAMSARMRKYWAARRKAKAQPMLNAEAKQKIFDHCPKKSGFPNGVGVGTVATLTTLFGCMRIRLLAENATADEVKAFVAVIAKAIHDDTDLKGKKRADEPIVDLLSTLAYNRFSHCGLETGHVMVRDKRLAELARSLHRAAERLWLRVTDPGNYDISESDVAALQKANTDLNRAITKLKMKRPKK